MTALIKKLIFLLIDFLRPFDVGGFFVKEKIFFWPKKIRRPARLYVAVSHRHLFFHNVSLPAQIPANKIFSALRLEVTKILELLTDKNGLEPALVYWNLNGKYLVVFREKDFFQDLQARIPENFLLSGMVPAGVALLAWIWRQRKGILEDGYYLVRVEGLIEGFEWKNGKICGLLPSSEQVFENLVQKNKMKVFEVESELDPEELLAQGASFVPYLPESLRMGFNIFPVKIRPIIPKKALPLWLLPFLVVISGKGINFYDKGLVKELEKIEKELLQLKTEEKRLEKTLEQKKNLEKIKEIVKEFDQQPFSGKILEELAKLLPEGTWVRWFSFSAPDRINLRGESENTLEVIKKLEESPLLEEVKVTSTVTKNPRTGKENFNITARISPQKKKIEE